MRASSGLGLMATKFWSSGLRPVGFRSYLGIPKPTVLRVLPSGSLTYYFVGFRVTGKAYDLEHLGPTAISGFRVFRAEEVRAHDSEQFGA